jgi:predicted transcriptional regulator
MVCSEHTDELLAPIEAARRLGRDAESVHDDAHSLLNSGILEKNGKGLIEFPYDAVHINFTLKAA